MWLLDGLDIYCGAVVTLLAELNLAQPTSVGSLGLLSYLEGYVSSVDFRKLSADICNIRTRIASIRYTLLIGDGALTISLYDDESNYSGGFEADFYKFKQGAVKRAFVQIQRIRSNKSHRSWRPRTTSRGSSRRYSPGLTPSPLITRSVWTRRFADLIERFSFIFAMLSICVAFEEAGLQFCNPRISSESKQIRVDQTFDVSLAILLTQRNFPVVTNDFHLDERERILFVSGRIREARRHSRACSGNCTISPRSGCLSRAKRATLLFDQIFTHFEKRRISITFAVNCMTISFESRGTLTQATSAA